MAVIVISGATSSIGRALIPLFHKPDHNLILIDPSANQDLLPNDITLIKKGLKSSSIRNLVKSKIDIWIHIGIEPPYSQPWQWTSEGTQILVRLISEHAYNIGAFIYISSSMVYGAHPDNPQFLTEDSPLRGGIKNPYIAPYVEGDLAVTSLFWKTPDIRVLLLRPTFLLGPSNNIFANYLKDDHPLVVLGFDPIINVLHIDDFITILNNMIFSELKGIYNVSGPNTLSLLTLIETMGKTPLYVPISKVIEVVYPGLNRYLKYVCMVDDSKLKGVMGEVKFKNTNIYNMLYDTLNPQLSLIPLQI